MLEKNKDYLEMRVSSTECALTQNVATTISIEGFSYDTSFRLPDPGESYVIVSKEKFEKMQESVVYYMALSTRAQYWKDKCEQLQFDLVHYKELARQWESNYRLLLAKTGFTNIEDIIDYIHDTSMTSPEDKTLKEIIEECEEDYISERDKAEALKTENEQLKKKLAEFSPAPGYREFLKALYPEATEATIEKLIWTTGQLCCGRDLQNALQTDLEYYRAISSAQAKSIGGWKGATGCSTPEEAKTLIESGMSYEYAYHEEQKKTRKLADDVKSWKNVTGYSTPEDYMHARLNNTTPFDYTAAWLKATGCSTPEEVKSRIEGLENAIRLTNKNMLSEIESNIDEWQKATGCVSPEKALYKITDLYNRIDKMKEAASIASNWTDKIVEG